MLFADQGSHKERGSALPRSDGQDERNAVLALKSKERSDNTKVSLLHDLTEILLSASLCPLLTLESVSPKISRVGAPPT